MKRKCNNCCLEFDYPSYAVPYDITDLDVENEPVCPRCHSFNITQQHLCEMCNEYCDDDLCNECKSKADAILQYAYERFGMESEEVKDLIDLAVN